MNIELARHNMVVEQLERRGIYDPRVLEAMEWVPRHEFVPPEHLDLAYEDRALPIGFEQTISQPYTVGFMCQEARLTANDKVLEVGAGSGYGAALLSLLTREVHTVERIEALFRMARDRLSRLGYSKAHCHFGDGTNGLPEEAPFDAIIVAAGAAAIPEPYKAQLVDGGRLVMPVGPLSNQIMVRLTRRGDDFLYDELGSFGFVPLVKD